MPSNPNIIASVLKAAEVLQLFKSSDELGIADISKALDYPMSSVHRLVTTLEQAGFVYQNQQTAKYRLGLELFVIGSHVKIIRLLAEKAQTYIDKLAGELNESIHISVLQGSEVVAVLSASANRQITVLPHIGQRRHAHATAVGKCMLAYNCNNSLEHLLSSDAPLEAYTDMTITDRAALIQELDRVKAQGYAIDNEEAEEYLICVAAPIFGPNRTCIASLSCSVPKNRYLGNEDAVRDAVVDAAKKISAAI